MTTSAAAPSLRPDALAAVTVPSFLNAGRTPDTLSIVTPARIYSSSSTIVSPLRPLTVTGGDLVLEPARAARGFGLVLAGDREVVLLGARHLILLGEVLGGDPHVIAVEHVGQPVLDHRVDQARSPILVPAAQILRVRRQRHRFLPARDDDRRVAGRDRLRRQRDRAQARSAHLVDAPGGHFLGHARRHRRLARRVLALARRSAPGPG